VTTRKSFRLISVATAVATDYNSSVSIVEDGMNVKWSNRIRNRGRSIPGGSDLLKIAARPGVMQDMRERVRRGEKPVTALSKPALAEIGERARVSVFKMLAGEVTAFIVERYLGCVRASGSHVIVGDPLFSNGQPFREAPGAAVSDLTEATEAICAQMLRKAIAAMSIAELTALTSMIKAEEQQRPI
jgi:hypothetical protein